MPAIFILNLQGLLLAGLLLLSLPSAAHLSEALQLNSASGTLHGSLLRPNSTHPVPLALIVPGSGPTDRNGNNPYGAHNDSLKKLAERLAAMGVASVRYDKRGVAQSVAAEPDETKLTVERYVEDIRGWLQLLERDPRFSQLILIGHSEGALLASLASHLSPIDALIVIAGSGRPVAQVLRDQLSQQLPAPLLAQSLAILTALEHDQSVGSVSEPLHDLFRPSVQPYLRTLFRYDPVQALAASPVPVLIIQGDKDVQVSTSDAKRLAKAHPLAELEIIEGMNHILRFIAHPKAQWPSYNDTRLPLAEGLGMAIERFLRKQGILPPSSDNAASR